MNFIARLIHRWSKTQVFATSVGVLPYPREQAEDLAVRYRMTIQPASFLDEGVRPTDKWTARSMHVSSITVYAHGPSIYDAVLKCAFTVQQVEHLVSEGDNLL